MGKRRKRAICHVRNDHSAEYRRKRTSIMKYEIVKSRTYIMTLHCSCLDSATAYSITYLLWNRNNSSEIQCFLIFFFFFISTDIITIYVYRISKNSTINRSYSQKEIRGLLSKDSSHQFSQEMFNCRFRLEKLQVKEKR